MTPRDSIAAIVVLLSIATVAPGHQTSPPTIPVAVELPQDVVADDNTRITRSCRLILAPRPLVDAGNDGVIQIDGDDITVDLGGQTLIGSDPGTPQNQLRGIGIRVRGKRVTIRNGVVTGFRVGISGSGCDHTVIERIEFIRNFSQRLGSTPEQEDSKDWLWPHKNDADEWATEYGAAISIRDAQGVIIREVGVRQCQNGILLSRVSNAQIYNCDASFLSGWGIALWRSCANTICRNSFDFCVRGYSHGIYNRGQDSAGILCFEQSSDNTIALNSATHCGDGFFGFAGREALGESEGESERESKQVTPDASSGDANWHLGRGCNRNLVALNDFSDSAAHGLEMTFSFDNRILRNRFDRNAICGIWGGYSQRLVVRGNQFRANGDVGRGLEGGGINVEHGRGTLIADNQFSTNSAGVRLWWDEDQSLASTPWAKANGTASTGNSIIRNAFNADTIGVFLRSSPDATIAANTMIDVREALVCDESSGAKLTDETTLAPPDWTELVALEKSLPGAGNAVDLVDGFPISKRNPLIGRAAIVIGEFGPYDFIAPMAVAEPGPTNVHRWKLLGSRPIQFLQASKGQGDLRTNIDPPVNTAIVETETLGQLTNYELAIFWGRAADQVQRVRGTLLNTNWRLDIFPLSKPVVPGTPPDTKTFDDASKGAYRVYVESLTFPFGTGGPDSVKLMPTGPTVPKDHFGIRATTTFLAASGDWIIRTRSDDGIRVWIDGKIVIERWTHHGTMTDEGRFSIPEPRDVTMSVDYFELDGDAILDLRIVPDPASVASPQKSAP